MEPYFETNSLERVHERKRRLTRLIAPLACLFISICCYDARFRCVKAPTSAELTARVYKMAQRIDSFLERQGQLERDNENCYLTSEVVEEISMQKLLRHSVTYRIAVGPQV